MNRTVVRSKRWERSDAYKSEWKQNVSKNGKKSINSENWRKLCDISRNRQSNAIVNPIDDYYLHEDNTITIGRDRHKQLLNKYSTKLKKTGEVEVDFNLANLKPKFKLKIRPLDEGLDHIQDYLIKKSEVNKTTDLKKLLHGAQIVCSRRTLKLLGLSAYFHTSWKFAIEKYCGVYFLRELGKASSKKYICDNEYFGYIFEELIFARPGECPPESGVISTYEKMYVATCTELSPINTENKKIKIFSTASIDGLDRDGKYVEAKARNLKRSWRIQLEWWLQSKFASIETIIQGIKKTEDEAIKIKQMRRINLVDLNLGYKKWEGNVSFGAIHQILTGLVSNYDDFMRKLMKNEQMENQPQLTMMKDKTSCRIYLSENKELTAILKPEFKNRFS